MLIDKSLHRNATAPANQNSAADPGAAGGNNGNSSISDMFTTLLAAQIQNQDPLAPMEAGQFVTQFAQLSQVEAMQSMASINAAAAPTAATVTAAISHRARAFAQLLLACLPA